MLDKGKAEILFQMFMDIDDFMKAKLEHDQKLALCSIIQP